MWLLPAAFSGLDSIYSCQGEPNESIAAGRKPQWFICETSASDHAMLYSGQGSSGSKLAGLTISIPKTEVVVFGGGHQSASGMWGVIASSVVNLSFIWACFFMRTNASSMRFSIAWLEAMRLRCLSSHGTLGLAVQFLSSSFCGSNRQFCSLVPPMCVRCGLKPQLALALSGIFSTFSDLPPQSLPCQEKYSCGHHISGAATDALA